MKHFQYNLKVANKKSFELLYAGIFLSSFNFLLINRKAVGIYLAETDTLDLLSLQKRLSLLN